MAGATKAVYSHACPARGLGGRWPVRSSGWGVKDGGAIRDFPQGGVVEAKGWRIAEERWCQPASKACGKTARHTVSMLRDLPFHLLCGPTHLYASSRSADCRFQSRRMHTNNRFGSQSMLDVISANCTEAMLLLHLQKRVLFRITKQPTCYAQSPAVSCIAVG